MAAGAVQGSAVDLPLGLVAELLPGLFEEQGQEPLLAAAAAELRGAAGARPAQQGSEGLCLEVRNCLQELRGQDRTLGYVSSRVKESERTGAGQLLVLLS